jgi:hypothetical protein
MGKIKTLTDKKYVWEFTNQRKLSKSEFINYFERKVFKTIRKYGMLPKNKLILLKKSNNLNTTILKKVLETKFSVKYSSRPNFSSENLSEAAEDTFEMLLQGKFSGPKPHDKMGRPLYFHSDKEVALYAKLMNIKGIRRKQNKKIQALFSKFLKKNKDLEKNIVKALEQIKE